jgi:predicted nucleic acid-binding protein
MPHIPKIYLETTMFNFPFANDAPQYRADTLRLFEEIKAGKFQPYTSVYVTGELDGTEDPVHREAMKTLIDDYHVTVLPASDEAERLAAVYIAGGAVKATYPTDALHIAMAAVNELDFIVSLNFQHIVKRKTIEATARVNSREGYRQIGIYQPSEVINDDDENG